ncbi:MAG TPA: hypothetical protein P5163_00010 [Rubrivivax sp.]|nr:hypothetical protein [Rubrivivax sp.]
MTAPILSRPAPAGDAAAIRRRYVLTVTAAALAADCGGERYALAKLLRDLADDLMAGDAAGLRGPIDLHAFMHRLDGGTAGRAELTGPAGGELPEVAS